MKTPFRSLIAIAVAATALATAFAVPPAHAAKDVVFAVASTFTTTDPYDANDTLSQAMAKSFYEGLFGFDKDMKMIPVLAESYDVSKDGLVYTIKLRKGRQVPRRDRLQGRCGQGESRSRHQSGQQAEALRPLQQQHREDRGRRRLHGAHHAEDAVLAVHRAARPSVDGDDQPGRARQVRQQGHRVQSRRHRPVQVRRMESHRLPQGGEVRRLLEERLSESRHDHVEARRRQQFARGDDADRRSAFHVPRAVRDRGNPEGQAGSRGGRGAVDRAPLPVDERSAKTLRQPEGPAGDRLLDQQGGAREGRLQRLRGARRRRGSGRRRVRVQAGPVAVRRGEGKAAADRSRLSERLRDRALVGV